MVVSVDLLFVCGFDVSLCDCVCVFAFDLLLLLLLFMLHRLLLLILALCVTMMCGRINSNIVCVGFM